MNFVTLPVPSDGAPVTFPFEVQRVYLIKDTPTDAERGFHAHKNLRQVVVPVTGACTFVLDDGRERAEVRIDNPNEGLFLEGLIWREMKDFTPDCILVVFASEKYSESDYIRDYQEFKRVALIDNSSGVMPAQQES